MQIVKATTYYRRRGVTGWVLVHPSGPYHCPGRDGKRQAEKILARSLAIQQRNAQQPCPTQPSPSPTSN